MWFVGLRYCILVYPDADFEAGLQKMKPEFENYELLEPIPRFYGYSGALVSFVLFMCFRPAVQKYAIPESVAELNRWKWRNILISWCHSAVVGAWVLSW